MPGSSCFAAASASACRRQPMSAWGCRRARTDQLPVDCQQHMCRNIRCFRTSTRAHFAASRSGQASSMASAESSNSAALLSAPTSKLRPLRMPRAAEADSWRFSASLLATWRAAASEPACGHRHLVRAVSRKWQACNGSTQVVCLTQACGGLPQRHNTLGLLAAHLGSRAARADAQGLPVQPQRVVRAAQVEAGARGSQVRAHVAGRPRDRTPVLCTALSLTAARADTKCTSVAEPPTERPAGRPRSGPASQQQPRGWRGTLRRTGTA